MSNEDVNVITSGFKEEAGGFLRRLFRNSKGDWKEAERVVKEINTYGDVIEGLVDDLVKADKKLRELQLKAYAILPEVESLFYDSPCGPSAQTYALRAYLKKQGWDGIRDVFTPTPNIPTFSKVIKDSTRWMLKFKK